MTKKTRIKKGKKVSAGMVETRSQKASEDKRARLEVENHENPTLDENWAGCGTEENRNRRLTSESAPVEQGQVFATFTGTFDWEKMSKLPDISSDNPAVAGSPTENKWWCMGLERMRQGPPRFRKDSRTLWEFSFYILLEREQVMK